MDAIWFNPWYPSPMFDAGYDIADYRGIDPVFGTLADADALITEAHALGIKIIIDVVPNHSSFLNPWFTEALAAGPGSAARDRFWFRPGTGPDGDQPPNNWQSIFGGPAWTRVNEPDGTPGEWYLHLFAPEQPDFNWASPDVRREFEDVLRFWFDRGVDGIRIDSAALLCKDPALPDLGDEEPPAGLHPYSDRDDVHEIYRSWRAITDEAPGRVLVGEVWLPDAGRLAHYVNPGELHTVFNFPYLSCPWDASALRQVIDQYAGPAGRRPGDLGAVQPRRRPDRHQVRPCRYRVQPRPAAVLSRLSRRPRTRHQARAGGGAADDGPARRRLHLPGRGTRARGGAGHPRWTPSGPDLATHARGRPRPGRFAGAAAVVGD